MDKTPIAIISTIILITAIFLVWYYVAPRPGFAPVPVPEGTLLFYGDGCPHCENVEDFIAQNKIEDKIKFTRLEVWNDKDNQTILVQVLQECQINASEVGVPFLYNGAGKCYIGEIDIINFFKEL